MKVPLPHGAFVDKEENLIEVNLGSVYLKFNFNEWDEFVQVISDIDSVVQTNLEGQVFHCDTCGTMSHVLEYKEPNENEYN